MTHRERFYSVVNHKQADRAVFDLAGSPQTLIDYDVTKNALAARLGITGEKQGNFNVDERILKYFDIDLRKIGGMPTPKTSHNRTENGISYDAFGIGYRAINGHMEICYNPLKDADIDEVMAYELPDAENIDRSGILAVLDVIGTIFRSYWFIVIIVAILLILAGYVIAGKIHRNRQRKRRKVKKYRNF